jgi:SNF2 family DNA or RNA helicase
MLVYIGDKEERAQLREEPFDVCVASYEMALRDTEFFSGIRWKNMMFGS